MGRDDLIRQLAPVAPPCFSTRDLWTEYLVSIDKSPPYKPFTGPLVIGKGQVSLDPDAGLKTAGATLKVQAIVFKGRVASFNWQLDFCSDCRTAFRVEMEKAGKCRPRHLSDLLCEATVPN